MESIISVVLTSKSYLLKAGLEAFLTEFSYVSVVAAFDGTEPGLDLKIKNLKPDIVIVNPDKTDELFKQLLLSLRKEPTIQLVAITDHHLPDEIRGKLNEVITTNMDKMALTKVINKILLEKGVKTGSEETDHRLSERETDILKHVAYGQTNQEIANKLFLSVHTVTTHRKNITRKLGIKTVSGLTVYALMNKLVIPSEIEKKN
jgi:DNA-binding NarL/FixJ family response regulator